MRIILLLLFALYFESCQAQVREVNRIDVKFDMTELRNKGTYFGEARVLAVDDAFAIGQIGFLDIFLLDLRSGNVVKSIDTDMIIKNMEEHIHELLGDVCYVPDFKEYRSKSKYSGPRPYDFRGLFHGEKRKFVTHMVTIVFNRMDDLQQFLFPSLVFFDKNLSQIEIIPFDPLNMSTISAWSNGGFFLGRDRMFTYVRSYFVPCLPPENLCM